MAQGWKATEIIDHVDKRTERRASKLIDLRREFYLALDEFCGEQHYWWRKKRGSFTTVIGNKTYDLADTNGANMPDVVQIETAWLIDTDGMTPKNELVLILDAKGQIKAALNTTQDVPAGFFIDTNASTQTLSLQAPSSVAQKILLEYWAVPMVSTAEDTTDETIPLVPRNLQWGLFYALERRVFEFLYGQEDPRFTVASAHYEAFKEKASLFDNWTTRDTTSSRATPQAVNIVRAHK